MVCLPAPWARLAIADTAIISGKAKNIGLLSSGDPTANITATIVTVTPRVASG